MTATGERVERVDEHDRVIGVVDRGEAVARHWPHRVATTVCRDAHGRFLVHRRPETVSRFPGAYTWLIGGAAEPGESYERAAAHELTEEIGVRAPVRPLFRFLCRGAISPYWLGVHEAVVTADLTPDPAEIAWHAWVTGSELRAMAARPTFVPDGAEVLRRHPAGALRPDRTASPS
ncbi:NUDIX hydrolase [Streptomyces sp. NPDC003401]